MVHCLQLKGVSDFFQDLLYVSSCVMPRWSMKLKIVHVHVHVPVSMLKGGAAVWSLSLPLLYSSLSLSLSLPLFFILFFFLSLSLLFSLSPHQMSNQEHHELYELLMSYLKSMQALSNSQKHVEALRGKYHTHQVLLWHAEPKEITCTVSTLSRKKEKGIGKKKVLGVYKAIYAIIFIWARRMGWN